MNLCFRSPRLSRSDRLTLRQLDYTTDPSENHRTSGEEGQGAANFPLPPPDCHPSAASNQHLGQWVARTLKKCLGSLRKVMPMPIPHPRRINPHFLEVRCQHQCS